MRLSLALLLGIFLVSPIAKAEPPLVNRVEGLDGPESAYYDLQTQLVFVTSMGPGPLDQQTLRPQDGGDPIAKNGKGTISVLRADGSLWKKDLFTGLNSPKGIIVLQKLIVVAEKDSITMIRFSQKDKNTLPHEDYRFRQPVFAKNENGVIRNAQLLNDLTVVPTTGDVFVTDTFGDRIYRISEVFHLGIPGTTQPGTDLPMEEFVRGLHLLSPNGIVSNGKKLWVVGSDTFTGLGNFTTQVGKTLPDPEKPAPLGYPNLDASVSGDPFDPQPISDPKRQDGRDPKRQINPANSFYRAHHGKVYSVDIATKKIEMFSDPDGGFDGVAWDQNYVLVGDWGTGEIKRVNPGTGETSKYLTLVPARDPAKNGAANPSDFSVNTQGRLLYVPNNTGGEVQTYNLSDY